LFGPASVTVLAGGGGNGGGGLVAARHLANRGISVTVMLARAEQESAPSRCSSATFLAGWGCRSPPSRRRRTW
jgi:NAD(P)H-hydrate epimerase